MRIYGVEQEKKRRSNVDVIFLLITWLEGCVITVVRCLEERRKRRERRQKDYVDTYAKLVGIVTGLSTENVKELAKNWYWDENTEKDDRMSITEKGRQ